MIEVIRKASENAINKVKKRVYGRTFYCPVCHLELSYHDVDEHGLVVCPLCGVVIELADVFGHPVPVVQSVEIKRVQPKLRVHPISTHLPIGLFPFALLGAGVLFLASLFFWMKGGLPADRSWFRLINNVTVFLLIVSIASSVIAFISGLWDWMYRYQRRSYRQITLKIWFSGAFLVFGVIAIVLHLSGAVFGCCSGLIPLSANAIIAAAVYFAVMIGNMIMLATLGHVGGLLVIGK